MKCLYATLFILYTLFTTEVVYASFNTSNLFEQDFKIVLNDSFSDQQLHDFRNLYEDILVPDGDRLNRFPLQYFKDKSIYKENIDRLLYSGNINQRIVAYWLIASAGDSTKESVLLEKLDVENEDCGFWVCFALLHLKCNKTTKLFDYLVKHEDFGDAHMLPFYVDLDKDSLRETAYNRINYPDVKSKILAIQILSVTGNNNKTEGILLNALKNWDINIKGYVLYTIKELEIGNLLPVLLPIIDSQQINRIGLQALANSPSEHDRAFVKKQLYKGNSINTDILDILYQSKRIENIRFWLSVLRSSDLPSEYRFSVFMQPSLMADSMLSEIHTVLLDKNLKPPQLADLVRVLGGRNDEMSINLFIKFLCHNNEEVRIATALALSGNKDERIKKLVPVLLQNKSLRTGALTELAIDYNIDTLQDLYEQIYEKSSRGAYWNRQAIIYLSTYPKLKHKELFKDLLYEKHDFGEPNATSYVCFAADGLAKLEDTSFVDRVITLCEENKVHSDWNALCYITALTKMKTPAAKNELLKFTESKELKIRELVMGALSNW